VLGSVLTEESIGGGLLGRVLLVRGRDDVPPRLDMVHAPLPKTVADWAGAVRCIAEFEGDTVEIGYADGAATEVGEITMRFYEAERAAKDDRQRAVLRRSAEKCKRIAGVLAVADDPTKPRITLEHLRWGEAFVLACNAHLVDFISIDMVGPGVLGAAARVKGVIDRILAGKIAPARTSELELVRMGGHRGHWRFVIHAYRRRTSPMQWRTSCRG